MVERVRRYGVWLVAAFVLLPPQLAVLVALGAVAVYYICIQWKLWGGAREEPVAK